MVQDKSQQPSWQARFNGIERLYGSAGAKAIANAEVAVVGLGGVGSWLAEALVRSGVGALKLIDLDDVCISNSNRQLQACAENIGSNKAAALAARFASINPQCQLNPIADFISADNLAQYLGSGCSVVADAIDDAYIKAALIAYCKRAKIGIITTGAAGAKTDPTQIHIADLSKTYNDPLSAKVRYLLRRNYGFSSNPKRSFGVPCVFSRQQLRYVDPSGQVTTNKNAMNQGARDCNHGFGAACMLTASIGMAAAAQVVDKIIAKNKLPMR